MRGASRSVSPFGVAVRMCFLLLIFETLDVGFSLTKMHAICLLTSQPPWLQMFIHCVWQILEPAEAILILNSSSAWQFVTQRPIRPFRPFTCLFLSHHALFIAALCPVGRECRIDLCSEAQIELICSLQDLPYTCSLVWATGRPVSRLRRAISGLATDC